MPKPFLQSVLAVASAACMLFFFAAPVQAAAFPLNEDFSAPQPADWELRSNASWAQTYGGDETLELTAAIVDSNGLGFYDAAFDSSNGIVAEFRYYADDGTIPGGDGLSFFLVDGDQVDDVNISPGAFGGALGYAQNNAPTDGVPHAYLGIGFDEYGNFVTNKEGKEGGFASEVPDSVGLRGSGNGTTGYAYLTSVDISSTLSETIDNGWRQARVTILPGVGSATIRVEMRFDDTGDWQTVIDDYTYNEAPPANLKLGFAASTGSANNVHAIGQLDVLLPVNLVTTLTTAPAGSYSRGEEVSYTYEVTNDGPNAASSTSIVNSMPLGADGFTDVSWSASVSNGTSSSGTGADIKPLSVDLPVGETVTVHATGTVGAEVTTADDLSHEVTANLSSDFSNPSPSAAEIDVSVTTDVPTPTESAALAKIADYAASNGASSTPSVSDYNDAGATDVTADNLDTVNTAIAAKDVSDLETLADVQTAVEAPVALAVIQAYAESAGASTTPTVSDYETAGASDVDAGNLDEINAAVVDAGSVGSLSSLQSLIERALHAPGGARMAARSSSSESAERPTVSVSKVRFTFTEKETADQGNEELQATIDELRQVVLDMQNKQNGISSAESNLNTDSNCEFSRDLELGSEGADVRCLQQELNARGFTLADSGPGAPGEETIYFAARTEAALRLFQEAHRADVLTPLGLDDPTGYFGEMTRRKIEQGD